MAGPTATCGVKDCRKGAMKQFAYQLEEVPITLEIPLCGPHVGIMATDPAIVVRAMDEETAALRKRLQEEIDAEVPNSGIVVPNSGDIVLP